MNVHTWPKSTVLQSLRMLTNRYHLTGNKYILTHIYCRMMYNVRYAYLCFFLFIDKPLTVAFLLFAGEYRVDDVPHDVSRAC